MTYQIDFTASNYKLRSWRKWVLRLLLVAAVVALAWGVQYVYKVKNESTLNMKLAEYEAVAQPIEALNVDWDTAAGEFASLVKYYRLLWALNPTNFLAAMASPDAPRMRRGLRSQEWVLTTGGECRLGCRYVFDAGDKAEQTKGLEDEIVRAVTSVVQVVDGAVDVRGVQHENLLGVDELNVSVRFALPDVRPFPAKEATLADCVSEIAAMRKKVQETKFADGSDARGVAPTAQAVMMAYFQRGRDKPDFPTMTNVLDVAGWFGRVDQFCRRNNITGDVLEQKRLKDKWNAIGDARWPWDRFRVLDNEELVARTKVLGEIFDGVKRFKVFLEKRKTDNRKKLEPFVEAYEHNDVFNKPLVESDLKDRVAAAAGVSDALVTFKDEVGAEAAELVKEDEKFVFTWVRWTLSVGAAKGRDGDRRTADGESGVGEPVSLQQLTDCARRALTLGPGYVLEKIKVSFAADGSVAGAVLEGLLPVKRVEPLKEAKK